MDVVLDDIDSRPGSTTSLLRTIIGLYMRRIGGWISVADLVSLAEDLGIPGGRTRTAVVRLKQRGVLIPERRAAIGYALNPAALPMLARGDRRIFHVRHMKDDDPWCLLSFSIPESQRSVRHQLRRRLLWIGCGTASPALWICPDYLADEVEEILIDLDIRHHATLFRSETPRVDGDLAIAAAQWWDLPVLRQAHEQFQDTMIPLLRDHRDGTPAEAFRLFVTLVDSWRLIPYNDPGLPPLLLPPDWPGQRSSMLFGQHSAELSDPAWQHVASITATTTPDASHS